MATYFDKREQREKTIPDCSKAGLTWNSETQRCEQMSTINSLLMAANLLTRVNSQPSENQGMGFLDTEDYYDDWEYDNYWNDWGFSDYSAGGDYYYDDWGWYDPYNDEWGYWGDYQADPYSDLQSTLDWWGNLDSSAPFEYDPLTNTYRFPEPNTVNDFSDLQSTLDWWASLSQTPVSNDPWLPDNFWDWLTGTIEDIPGVTPTNPNLPGYCPAGTYHPVDNPLACVPFPTDPTANRAAQQQRKQQQQAAQKAAQAAKAAQKKQDQTCPKDAQGRQQWKNPQTGKCEPIPACPQGMVFDSASRRCLSPQQVKEIYGENNWLIWALIALGVLVVIKK